MSNLRVSYKKHERLTSSYAGQAFTSFISLFVAWGWRLVGVVVGVEVEESESLISWLNNLRTVVRQSKPSNLVKQSGDQMKERCCLLSFIILLATYVSYLTFILNSFFILCFANDMFFVGSLSAWGQRGCKVVH